jgi:hypothetical protein
MWLVQEQMTKSRRQRWLTIRIFATRQEAVDFVKEIRADRMIRIVEL